MSPSISPSPPRAAAIANWGILAHVDAGKTSLTERLLFETGAIDSLGSVDAGTSRTDSMDLERQRGITIRTNVASFFLESCLPDQEPVQVNLIDTPGHADFIAEVERSLAVLDAAILVVSAVEGVQPQTVVLWRALRRIGIPVVVFINKTDRTTADPDGVLTEIERRLTGPADVLAVPLADVDLAVMEDLLADRPSSPSEAPSAVRRAWGRGELVPILTGSAITGAGLARLTDLMAQLPAPSATNDEEGLSALVFKIDNAEHGRLLWARMFAGRLQVRDHVATPAVRRERVSGLQVVAPSGEDPPLQARPGDVVRLRGLGQARIGDWLGHASSARASARFAAPTLEAVVDPEHEADRSRMFAALTTLAEQDPLVDLRVDDERAEVTVTLFGEVQKDVITALLADQFDVAVTFRATTIRRIERITGTGSAHAIMSAHTTPYLATLGFTLSPAPIGTGVTVDLAVELGSMPAAFFTATREGITTGLAQGRFGWAIPDAHVTITHTGYAPRQSHAHQKFNKAMSSVAADFRYLAPMLVHRALAQAGTVVCEPISAFNLDASADVLDAAIALVSRHQGTVTGLDPAHDRVTVDGTIPTSQTRALAQALPDQTRGDAVLTLEHDHFRQMTGRAPTRSRLGADPLDTEAWLRAHPR